MTTRHYWYEILTLVSIFVLSLVLGGCTPGLSEVAKLSKTKDEPQKGEIAAPFEKLSLLKVFVEAFALIETNYVHEVNTKELMQGAIRGMMKVGDPSGFHMSYVIERITAMPEAIKQKISFLKYDSG